VAYGEGVAFFVTRHDAAAAGCGGIQLFGSDYGEIKRMYVAPDHRGHGVARALLERVIEEAQRRNYDTLRLGTLSSMHAAQTLYTSAGFREIEPYRAVEFGDTLFYELSLGAPD